MRVIAGVAKGRRLTAPAGEATRPTADRVKEALFSSLMPRLAGARVLDLFAGSGALGIEALSRGADHVTFVERSGRALTALHHNLEVTALVGGATVVARDVRVALEQGELRGPFDVVVLDPPYAIDRSELRSVLALMPPLLADGAVLVVELATRGEAPAWPAALRQQRARRYGDTTLYEAVAEVSPE